MCRWIFLLLVATKICAATYLPNQEPYRLIRSLDPAGATIEMDDNSIWRIEGTNSRCNVQNWELNDPIIIYPVTYTYMTGTRFFVYNQRTRTNANAELLIGPVVAAPTNNRIIHIDYMYGEVRLQDGQGNVSIWIAENNDLNIIQNWRLFQSVILGSNKTWPANWSSDCEYILINVENNAHIRASLY
jgi:hypothetical protein